MYFNTFGNLIKLYKIIFYYLTRNHQIFGVFQNHIDANDTVDCDPNAKGPYRPDWRPGVDKNKREREEARAESECLRTLKIDTGLNGCNGDKACEIAVEKRASHRDKIATGQAPIF